jgi:hypothetical protein
MRMFLLIAGGLIFLALGSLEVIAAHNVAAIEDRSASSAGAPE